MKLRDVAVLTINHVDEVVTLPEGLGVVHEVDVIRVEPVYHQPKTRRDYVYVTAIECGAESVIDFVAVPRAVADKLAKPCAQCYPRRKQ